MALWTPAEITTEGWFDAADAGTITLSGSEVTQWADKSGNARHMGDMSRRPTYETASQNGLNAVVLDNSAMSWPGVSLPADDWQLFVAHDQTQTGGSWGCFLDAELGRFVIYSHRSTSGASGFYDGDFTTLSPNVAGGQILHYELDATARQLRDGVQVSAPGGYTQQPIGGQIAWFAQYEGITNYARGKMWEILLIKGAVSEADRHKIEGYLAHKWGLEANLPADHPYKTDAPQVASTGVTVDRNASVASASTINATALVTRGRSASVVPVSTLSAASAITRGRTADASSVSVTTATIAITRARAASVASASTTSVLTTATRARAASTVSASNVSASYAITSDIDRIAGVLGATSLNAAATVTANRSASVASVSTVDATAGTTTQLERSSSTSSTSIITVTRTITCERNVSVDSVTGVTTIRSIGVPRVASIASASTIGVTATIGSMGGRLTVKVAANTALNGNLIRDGKSSGRLIDNGIRSGKLI